MHLRLALVKVIGEDRKYHRFGFGQGFTDKFCRTQKLPATLALLPETAHRIQVCIKTCNAWVAPLLSVLVISSEFVQGPMFNTVVG